jgi:hypothetical protein
MRLFMLAVAFFGMTAVGRADERRTCYTSAENRDWTL